MAAALLAGTGEGYSQCNYEAVVIQAPSCGVVGPPATTPTGMNAHGHVVGYYAHCWISGRTFGFIWKPETGLVTLPSPPDATEVRPADINDLGFIVGSVQMGAGYRGFVWDPNTEAYTFLPPLHDGVIATTVSTASAINNNFVVVGSRVISQPGVAPVLTNAIIWYPFGVDGDGGEAVTIDLGTFGVGPNSAARAINDDGAVCGWTGTTSANGFGFVRRASGDDFVLGPEWGVVRSVCQHLDSSGLVAGGLEFQRPQISLGFTWNTSAIVTFAPPLGFTGTGVAGINDHGQVLVRVAPGLLPALIQHGQLTMLSELANAPPNVVLNQPVAISNSSAILSRATVSGNSVGTLLMPVDRPVTDLNADCVTNIHDLFILLNEWGPCKDCDADFTEDGRVGVPDLLLLLSNWG